MGSKTKIVLFGYSGHAYVVCDAILSQNNSIAGYLTKEIVKINPYNLDYLGFETNTNDLYKLKSMPYFISIGDNIIRANLFSLLKPKIGYPVNVIHKSAIVSKTTVLQSGVFIGPKAIVNSMSKIGEGCIINSGAIIEHECVIGSFSHVAPGAILAGNVSIGNQTFVGAGASIINGITIGNNVIIGAGAVIIKDIPDGITVVGNPGRNLKNKT